MSLSGKRCEPKSRCNTLECAIGLLFAPKQVHYYSDNGENQFTKNRLKNCDFMYAKIRTQDHVLLDLRCAHTNFRRQLLDLFATKAHHKVLAKSLLSLVHLGKAMLQFCVCCGYFFFTFYIC